MEPQSQIVLVRRTSPTPRLIGALPQLTSSGASPIAGAAELGVGGALLFAAAGALIGHLSKSKSMSRDAMIGAGIGAVAGGALGYYEAKNPSLTVSPNGTYTVTVPANGTLKISAPSGATGSNSGSGATSSASFSVNGTVGQLDSGSNTISISWSDASGNAQSATVTVTAP